jgi:DNA-binding MarR family transcriptional regulator
VTGATSDVIWPTGADDHPGGGVDALTVEGQQRAQRLLLILSRLGAAVSAALHSRVDAAFASNGEVLVITSLDLLGPQRRSDILALTGMTSGGVTRVLDRLEEHGLMVREFGHVEGDRRGTRLLLTPEGRRIAAELATGLASRLDAVRDAIEELRDTATT